MTIEADEAVGADVKVLVFDLDGTLVPTMEDYANRAAQLMEEAFGTPFAQARHSYFATSGLPFERQLRQLYPGHETDPVAERFEAWKDGYLAGITISPTVAGLLEGWRRQGLLVAISSNNLEVYVDRLAQDWPVDCAFGYRAARDDDPGFAKGEPHFAALEQRFGVSRSAFLFTGDSPNDAQIAAAAGVRFRALLTDAFCADDFEKVVPGTETLTSLTELSGLAELGGVFATVMANG
ncbi:MAG: HAD hydrolase-like protein [Novosphingobium sp.]|uniref:HAD family hydrolase n=1 Tax=Novosphingobium sp. TaxID=1874826 RepID=UPI002732E14D|nr:HAD family hydrolase [Novosphingobium sp.]MDP3552032.1 HAD hydrolase-like protein [Novosphingobium sp.]